MVYILLFYDFNVLLLAKRMGKMVFHFAEVLLSLSTYLPPTVISWIRNCNYMY